MHHNLIRQTLQPKFVEFIPERLEAGILYVSMEYNTATHLCPCGCNNEVVTPISKKGWQITYDGDAVTLRPSVGSRKLPCRSHYFIIQNCIVDAGPLDNEEIEPINSREKKQAKKLRIRKSNQRQSN